MWIQLLTTENKYCRNLIARCHFRPGFDLFQTSVAFSMQFTYVVNITVSVHTKMFILMLVNTQIINSQYLFYQKTVLWHFDSNVIQYLKKKKSKYRMGSAKLKSQYQHIFKTRNRELLVVLFCYSNNNALLFNIYTFFFSILLYIIFT